MFYFAGKNNPIIFVACKERSLAGNCHECYNKTHLLEENQVIHPWSLVVVTLPVIVCHHSVSLLHYPLTVLVTLLHYQSDSCSLVTEHTQTQLIVTLINKTWAQLYCPVVSDCIFLQYLSLFACIITVSPTYTPPWLLLWCCCNCIYYIHGQLYLTDAELWMFCWTQVNNNILCQLHCQCWSCLDCFMFKVLTSQLLWMTHHHRRISSNYKWSQIYVICNSSEVSHELWGYRIGLVDNCSDDLPMIHWCGHTCDRPTLTIIYTWPLLHCWQLSQLLSTSLFRVSLYSVPGPDVLQGAVQPVRWWQSLRCLCQQCQHIRTDTISPTPASPVSLW